MLLRWKKAAIPELYKLSLFRLFCCGLCFECEVCKLSHLAYEE